MPGDRIPGTGGRRQNVWKEGDEVDWKVEFLEYAKRDAVRCQVRITLVVAPG
jgi:hypothetical protein